MTIQAEPDVLSLAERIAVEHHDSAPEWARHDPDALAATVALAAAASLTEMGRDDGSACYGLGVLFGSDEAIAALNEQWRGKPIPTNVLSWPGDMEGSEVRAAPDGSVHLGDLAFAVGVVEREAHERDLPLADHVAVLAVHGVMHCLGLDHPTTEDARAMEGIEARALRRIGVSDPYEGSEPM